MKNLVRTDFRDLLPIGWRYLSDALVVRHAIEAQAGGDGGPMGELVSSGRVVEVPDLAEVEVLMRWERMALVKFPGPDSLPVEAWTALAAVEPSEVEPDPGADAGNPHRGTTSRPRPPRW